MSMGRGRASGDLEWGLSQKIAASHPCGFLFLVAETGKAMG